MLQTTITKGLANNPEKKIFIHNC